MGGVFFARRRIVLLVISVVPHVFFSQSAAANVGDDIIVTASRLGDDMIGEVAVAVQVVDAQHIRDFRVNSVDDLSRVVPAFNISHSYQGVPQFGLRGVSFSALNISSTPTVTVYQDEVAYPFPFTQMGPMFDMSRAEVLKGPQGTLYGRNTTAGVIHLVTNRPTNERSASLAAEFGSYDSFNLEGHVNGPIFDGLSGRIAWRLDNSFKGWQKSLSRNERLGEVRRYGARASLRWDNGGAVRWDADLSYWYNGSDTLAGQGVAFVPTLTPGCNSGGCTANDPRLADYLLTHPAANARDADWLPSIERSTNRGLGLGIAEPLRERSSFLAGTLRGVFRLSDDLSLRSYSSVQKLRRRSVIDVSGAPFELLVQQPTGRIDTVSQELHLNGNSGPLQWMLGGYYAHDTAREVTRSLIADNASSRSIVMATPLAAAILPGFPGFESLDLGDFSTAFRTFSDDGHVRMETKSVLANASLALSSQLTLSGGLRYTRDRLDFSGCTRDVNGNTNQGANGAISLLILSQLGPHFLPPPVSGNGACATSLLEESPVRRELVTSRLVEGNWSWRAALNWRANRNLSFFLSASRGAKSGVNPILTANSAAQLAPVRQEKLTAYELGARLESPSGDMWFALNGFYYDYRDKQASGHYRDLVFTTLVRLVNLPRSRVAGLEINAGMTPLSGLRITLDATYADSRVLRYVGIDELGQTADFRGSPFAYAPRLNVAGTISYDRQIDHDHRVRAALHYRWQSSSNAILKSVALDASGRPVGVSARYDAYAIGAYGVMDVSLAVVDNKEQWRVSVWANNLLDRHYARSVITNANLVVKFAGEPRRVGVTLGKQF